MGDIKIERTDGRTATLSWPGRIDRMVALHRRDTAELLAEELRRLDPDEVYAETLGYIDAVTEEAAEIAMAHPFIGCGNNGVERRGSLGTARDHLQSGHDTGACPEVWHKGYCGGGVI